MINVTFITGNDKKAEFLAKYLGLSIPHKKLELDEIQSLNLREITEHKVRQAYAKLGSPVLVEDVSFVLVAMQGLPGPLIRWFLETIDVDGICQLADFYNDHRAMAKICYAYFDGKKIKFWEGQLDGTVPAKPSLDDGFGWNRIFIPAGQTKTISEMNRSEIKLYSLRTATIYPKLKKFLEGLS